METLRVAVVELPPVGVQWEAMAAWAQAILSALAIVVSGILASVPLRREAKRRAEWREDFMANLVRAVSVAGDDRRAASEALVTRERATFEERTKRLNRHDVDLAESLLDIPVADWPSLTLHAAIKRLVQAARTFDDKVGQYSFEVCNTNPTMSWPAARDFIKANDAAWAAVEAVRTH